MSSKNLPAKILVAEVALPIPVEQTFSYELPAGTPCENLIGRKVQVSFGPKKLIGIIFSLRDKADVSEEILKRIKPVEHVFLDQPGLAEEMIGLAKWMSEYYCCCIGEALSCVFPAKGYLRKKITAKNESAKGGPARVIELSEEQKAAYNRVLSAIDSNTARTFLLKGVTGSGKTEVYLQLFRKVLDEGYSGIFLLPEISLTPQFIKRACECFPGEVALWHSRLSNEERSRSWNEIASGGKKIVLGVRSAIFAPLSNIKLIVVDEEQEDTYKQDKKPQYHVREIAAKRAEFHNASVVLGSATPDIVSYYKAKTGVYELLELNNRYGSALMPNISLIDLKKDGIGRAQALMTPKLEFEVRKRLARREQIILFLNRRGYAPNCLCSKCGWTAKCPRCDVSLVKHEQWGAENRKYHQSDSDTLVKQEFRQKIKPEDITGVMKCHICGFYQSVPEKCGQCGSDKLVFFGIGTQKLEKELRRLFPEARMFRMDYDTTKERDIHQKIYDDFSKEKFDILFGTQMITKGFDFPRVTLVGIIDADIIMHMPDFRASEKTFRMIVQVAGRAGRKDMPGSVYIQTYYPEHFVMKHALAHDYKSFYEEDIRSRELFNYPPFSELINIIMCGKNEEDVARTIEALALDMNGQIELNKFADTISGPSAALRPLVRKQYRYQMVLRTNKSNKLFWSRFLKSQKIKSTVKLAIDVDPQSLF